jgi:ubiquinone biosynthesis protein UbiJ
MTKRFTFTKGFLLIVAATTVVSAVLYGSTLMRKLRDATDRLTEEQKQLRAVQSQREDLSDRCESYEAEINRLRGQAAAIHSLRAELNRLGREFRELELTRTTDAQLEGSALETLGTFAARIGVMRQALQTPSECIPELSLLTDRDWIEAAAEMEESSDTSLRTALSQLRGVAKRKFAETLVSGLRGYADAYQGKLPETLQELLPYLPAEIEASMLRDYTLVGSGSVDDLSPGESIVQEARDLHGRDEACFSIGVDGFSFSQSSGNARSITEVRVSKDAQD